MPSFTTRNLKITFTGSALRHRMVLLLVDLDARARVLDCSVAVALHRLGAEEGEPAFHGRHLGTVFTTLDGALGDRDDTQRLPREPQPVEMDFMMGGMIFSSDSKRLMYGGRRGQKCFLVVDEVQGPDFDRIGSFGFSPNGKRAAYVATEGERSVIVVDGKRRASYTAVPSGPVFRSNDKLEFICVENQALWRVEVPLGAAP